MSVVAVWLERLCNYERRSRWRRPGASRAPLASPPPAPEVFRQAGEQVLHGEREPRQDAAAVERPLLGERPHPVRGGVDGDGSLERIDHPGQLDPGQEVLFE